MTTDTETAEKMNSDLTLEKYTRKPFTVDAVQVTADNFGAVAEWCGGEVQALSDGVSYIKVDVNRPITTRQTRAFLGDWILLAGRGFKVYTEKAFRTNFVPESSITVKMEE